MGKFYREVVEPLSWATILGTGSYVALQKGNELYVSRGVAEAQEAYEAELLRAYQSTFPNDMNVTSADLRDFAEVASRLDESFRYSNFEYQNDVYEGMVNLYGAPRGEFLDLHNVYEAANSTPELLFISSMLFGIGSAVAAAITVGSTASYINDKRHGIHW